MASGSVPVDLLNPGQVFACIGLAEAAAILCGPCEGRFDSAHGDTVCDFVLNAPGDVDPVLTVLDFVWHAEVAASAPLGSELEVKEQGVATTRRKTLDFPSRQPATPSALPALLTAAGKAIPIEHWADGSTRDSLKFWAGAGGYSGAALTRDTLKSIQSSTVTERDAARRAPFDLEAPMSSSYRFDWRRDYVPMDVGFSPNNQSSFTMVGYPLVELLAVIGLQHSRPSRVQPRNKLRYRYAVSDTTLPMSFMRAVLGGASLGFPTRCFVMRLDWPGQEGQARCIVDAQEEFSQ